MHRITRSQFYLDKINEFIESNNSKIYLELYPGEVDRLEKRYSKTLNITMLNKVMAHKDDRRYHCLIEKK